MNRIVDEFKSLENELINKVLYFALGSEYTNELDRAKGFFRRILDENNYSYDEKNFVSWLLWNYKLENGNIFFKEYMMKKSNKLTENEYRIIESLSNTYLSIYEIITLQEKKKLKDIFSKKEFVIEEALEITNFNKLLIGRITNYDGQNYILDEYLTLDKRFQNGIEKTFYEKFEAYREKNKYCNIEEFIKVNSILLYSFAHIIDDIAKEQLENNKEYNVFQSNYVVLDNQKLSNLLEKSQDIELDYKENGILYFIMYEKDKKRVLSEVVLKKDKLEIECISEKDKDNAKKILEELAVDSIKYLSDEILTIDDIL